jgi:hypothetical protein
VTITAFISALPLAAVCLAGWTATQTTPAAAPETQVTLLIGDQRTTLTGVAPQPKWHNLTIGFLSFSHDVLTIDGPKSAFRIKTRTPTLVISLAAGVVAAEDVLLASLKLKDGRLEVGRERDVPSDINPDRLLALTIEPAEAGNAGSGRAWRATPKSPLKAGEYAVIIRSVFFGFGVD